MSILSLNYKLLQERNLSILIHMLLKYVLLFVMQEMMFNRFCLMNCISIINFSRLYCTLNVYFPMHCALLKVILSLEDLIHTSFLHDDMLSCITFGSLENSSFCLAVNFIPASKLILFCFVFVVCFKRNCSSLYYKYLYF